MNTENAEKIYQIMSKFHKIRVNSKMCGEIPHSEAMMLKMIKRKGSLEEGVTISDLSAHSQITKAGVSQMINALEDKGFVERFRSKNDRRLVYVRITEAGDKSLKKALQQFLGDLERIFAKMGEEDTKDLLRLLYKLYGIVAEYSQKEIE
ncbi:MAG: MarR family transcriptional regulator [Clostridia bacterium]|nr:MarR family transcriptional regulator [Clostridia bacterium]